MIHTSSCSSATGETEVRVGNLCCLFCLSITLRNYHQTFRVKTKAHAPAWRGIRRAHGATTQTQQPPTPPKKRRPHRPMGVFWVGWVVARFGWLPREPLLRCTPTNPRRWPIEKWKLNVPELLNIYSKAIWPKLDQLSFTTWRLRPPSWTILVLKKFRFITQVRSKCWCES